MFLPSWPGPKSELAHCGTSFFWPPKIVIFSKFKCLQWRSFFNWKYKKSSNLFVSCKFSQEISLVNNLYYFNHKRIFSSQWGLNFWSNRAEFFYWQAAIQSFGLARYFFVRSFLAGMWCMIPVVLVFIQQAQFEGRKGAPRHKITLSCHDL